MHQDNIEIAEAYYTALGKKNISELEKFYHPKVVFIGPMATLSGKEAVFQAAKDFTTFFNTLTIRTKFGSADQAMIVYDLDFPLPIGPLSASVLMLFEDGLISKFELFYDARPFEKKQ